MSLYFILLALSMINDPCAKMRVPDVIKNINVEVFNLMSRNNETRHINGMRRLSVNVD